MKNIFTKIQFNFFSFLLLVSLAIPSMASTHFTESFTSPNFPIASWANGGYTLSSGAWDVQNAMGMEALNAYNSSGGAAKLNRFLVSYLTSPAVNAVGTVSFYYRNFSTALGGGTFKVQKSINGGAFTDLNSITFTNVATYTYCSIAVNDASNNIKIRISCPASNTSYLCIDEILITDMGQALTANPSALTEINYYVGSGPSASQNFNLFGTGLSGYPGNISITAPTNYEISSDNSVFSTALNIAFTSATLPSTPIYVRLKTGLSLGDYNSEVITIVGGGATSIYVTCNGSVITAPLPILNVNSGTLSGFNYIFGSGPSVAQSYSITGTDLTGYPGNIVVTMPADYEVSLDYSTYTASVSLPYTSATLPSVVVYVRLKSGLAVNMYNSESISNNGGGAATAVVCNGSVDPPPSPTLSTNPTTLSGFNYIVGSGPSSAQSYNLSGGNLTGYPGNIVVTAPTNYEVSLSSGSGFSSNLNVPYTSATLLSTPIYIRLKAGLAIASYNSEILTNTGGGATTVNITCNGTVSPLPSPLLSLSSTTLTGFGYIAGSGPSSSQSFNLSGTNLTGYPDNIVITAPPDYEISNDNTTFYSGLNIAYTSSVLSSTAVYVRLKTGLSVASYNSEIVTNAGGGATTVNVTCGGSVSAVPAPALISIPTSLSGFTYIVGTGPSASQSYNLSGTNLTGYPGNIAISAPPDYEISNDNTTFYSGLNIAYTSSVLASTPIYVRLNAGLSVASYNSEAITNNGGGATALNVTCSGGVADISTSCANETFTNIPTTSSTSYSARTWIGDDGNTWNATTARTDQTITSKAICFKGYVESAISPNGIGDLTVTTKFPFADGTYNMPVLVNGVQVGTVPVSATISTTTLTGINVGGNVQIKFSSDGTKRPVIDDLSWTCYSVVTNATDIQNTYFKFSLYPNPAEDQVMCSIYSSEETTVVIEISNYLGQKMLKRTIISEKGNTIIPFDISSFRGGIYYVTVRSSDGKIISTKPLIIQ